MTPSPFSIDDRVFLYFPYLELMNESLNLCYISSENKLMASRSLSISEPSDECSTVSQAIFFPRLF